MDAKPTPTIQKAVEAVLSDLEHGAMGPFSDELTACFGMITCYASRHDPTTPIDAEMVVRGIIGAFWAGWHSRGAIHDSQELERLFHLPLRKKKAARRKRSRVQRFFHRLSQLIRVRRGNPVPRRKP